MALTAAAVHHKAAELCKLAVRMTSSAGSGHPSSALSLAHLVAYLMYHEMRWDPADPWHPAADRLVLSEGHAVPIIYAALADLGAVVGRDRDTSWKLSLAELDQLRDRGSVLDGHPNPAEGIPFFDAATGSLGQGLSVAAGLALAARLDRSDRRVYVLIGDGESREGQVWEAADFIADHKLSHVCAIFSANGQGQAGLVSPQQSAERLAAKLRAFNWEVSEADGHDPDAIGAAFARPAGSERPHAIVARTIKGWGVTALQDGNWHGKPLPSAKLAAAHSDLDRVIAAHGSGSKLAGPPSPSSAPAVPRSQPEDVAWPSFAEVMSAAGLAGALEKKRLSTRRAYGATLRAAGALLPQVVVLDGDVSNSTFTELFAQAYPERFFEGKIAEQNMVSAGVGLAAAGYIPFVNSFAKFIGRAYDQVEMANISRANIKLVGSHAGISPSADGPSQMALVDVAFFRAFSTVPGDDRASPLSWVFQPADAVAAYYCTRLMIEQPGMCYMRTHRPDVPLLYSPDARFELGGFHVLCGGDDLAIVASGFAVGAARDAVARLARQNIRAALLDTYCLPVDGDRLADALQRAGSRALVVEDNYGGGFGAAVAEIAARTGGLRVELLHCRRIPKSTRTAEEVLELCGVGPTQIADHALAMIRQPR